MTTLRSFNKRSVQLGDKLNIWIIFLDRDRKNMRIALKHTKNTLKNRAKC